nr:hypothetical protein 64 [bacterium]
MLKPLQPGIEPLGQFDIEDDDVSSVVGGEVATLQALDVTSDLYAADVFGDPGPQLHLTLSSVSAVRVFYGLVDEGTSAGGEGSASYGTLFGTVIGAVTGKGTGFGSDSTSGVVVVGPATMRGSGKATLWTKPGLYGVTSDAWEDSTEYDAASLNDPIYGDATAATAGKLTTSSGGNGIPVALHIGRVDDYSLVSTTNTMAGETSVSQYGALYLLGVQG